MALVAGCARMIGVVNYGIGNLGSVGNALAAAGAEFALFTDADETVRFEKLLLPGVGAFAACMTALKACGFEAPVRAHVAAGKPLLGICVGMQMLADRGTEFGDHAGLGLVPGAVVQIDRAGTDIRLPHVGWNPLTVRKDCPLMRGLPSETSAYFVHSFHLAVRDEADISATVEYGSTVTAAISRGNVFGAQFHPEKSQVVGLTVLKNFAAL